MATAYATDSFLGELLQGGIHTANDTFKLALYSGTSTLSRTTTAYGTTGEVSSSGTNYTAGGVNLTLDAVAGQADGTGARVRIDTTNHYAGYDWADAVFSNVTIAGLRASGFQALIYNSSKANRSVAICTWAINELANDPSAANLTITLPGSGNVVVRLG